MMLRRYLRKSLHSYVTIFCHVYTLYHLYKRDGLEGSNVRVVRPQPLNHQLLVGTKQQGSQILLPRLQEVQACIRGGGQ